MITNNLTSDDLNRIKKEQKSKNIEIEYDKVNYDSLGKLKSVALEVSYKQSNFNYMN